MKNRKNGVVFLQTIVTFLLGMEKGAYLENLEDSGEGGLKNLAGGNTKPTLDMNLDKVF